MKLSKKREAATLFVKEVLSRARHIYAIYLFGSLPKGTATPESDVDVLVVYSADDGGLHDILADASNKVYRETGEVVEYVTMDVEEYLSLLETSPFLYEVRRWGEVLYTDGASLNLGMRGAQATRMAPDADENPESNEGEVREERMLVKTLSPSTQKSRSLTEDKRKFA